MITWLGKTAAQCGYEAFAAIVTTFFELFPKYCILNQIRNELSVQDELSRGHGKIMRTKKNPIWLVLGCQIYLDIYHTMLSNIGKAHQDLRTERLYVSAGICRFLEGHVN